MNTCRADPVCLSLSALFNSRAAGQIWIKLCMDVMPLGFTLDTLRPYNDVWLQIFGKYETCIMYSRKVAAA
jgi:hypothetical protein